MSYTKCFTHTNLANSPVKLFQFSRGNNEIYYLITNSSLKSQGNGGNYEINARSLGIDVVRVKRFTFKYFENVVSRKTRLAQSHFVCLLANFRENSSSRWSDFMFHRICSNFLFPGKIYLRYLKLPLPFSLSVLSLVSNFPLSEKKTIRDTRLASVLENESRWNSLPSLQTSLGQREKISPSLAVLCWDFHFFFFFLFLSLFFFIVVYSCFCSCRGVLSLEISAFLLLTRTVKRDESELNFRHLSRL